MILSYSDLIDSDLILLRSYPDLDGIKLPYYQGGQGTLMSVAKFRDLAFGLSHSYEQHLRCPSGASVVLKMRLSVKHLPFQLELLFKKKK